MGSHRLSSGQRVATTNLVFTCCPRSLTKKLQLLIWNILVSDSPNFLRTRLTIWVFHKVAHTNPITTDIRITPLLLSGRKQKDLTMEKHDQKTLNSIFISCYHLIVP